MKGKNGQKEKVIVRFKGGEVKILKGLRSKDGEFFVEISAKNSSPRTVSAWKLSVSNGRQAENLFQNFFGVSFKEAQKIHRKIKRKNIQKLKGFALSNNLKKLLLMFAAKDQAN